MTGTTNSANSQESQPARPGAYRPAPTLERLTPGTRTPAAPGRLRILLHLIPLLMIVSLCIQWSNPQVAGAQESPEAQLANRYAPIAMLRQQSAACDKKGEGYFPSPVDFLFDNPDVALKASAEDGDSRSDPVLKTSLTPQDLVSAGPDTYLDFPGAPRNPGCEFERYFKDQVERLGLQPTTYAHIVVDPVERRLFLQYWFWYYFNDWNNTHETDWEMIQLIWDGATDAGEALERPPSRIGYAQHGGGEIAFWTDPKVQKDGDHPLVYPAAGSHATYYGSKTYIGWGERGTGFGCDNTTEPLVATPLDVVLVPDVIDPESPLAFFLYEGRWGERQETVFNGPTGPNLGDKWNDPSQSITTWRTTTLEVPSGNPGGVSATDFFCSVSEYGSKLFIRLGVHPWALVAVILVVLGALGVLFFALWPYLAEAIDIYGNELRTFLGIGAMTIPIGLIFAALVRLLVNYPPLDWLEDAFNQSTGGRAASVALLGGIQQLTMILLVTPAVMYAMKEIRQGIKPGVWHSYREVVRYWPSLAVALVILLVALALLSTSLLLIPLAIYLSVRCQFFGQAAVLDQARPGWIALKTSWIVTRGQLLKTLWLTIGFQLLLIMPGPLVGVLILIVGGSRVQFANAISSFIYAIFVPIAVIGLTITYRRLKGEEIIEADIRTHERDDPHRPAAHAEPQTTLTTP